MVSNLLEADVENVLDAAFAGTIKSCSSSDPSAETIVSLVEAAIDRDDYRRCRCSSTNGR